VRRSGRTDRTGGEMKELVASRGEVKDAHGGVKRRRSASCGTCAACVREDCGRCINCVDKPKFGGQGIRKQSCIHKRCSQPKGAANDDARDEPRRIPLLEAGNTPTLPKSIMKACEREYDAFSQEEEEEDPMFWSAVEGCMALFSKSHAPRAVEPAEPKFALAEPRGAAASADTSLQSPFAVKTQAPVRPILSPRALTSVPVLASPSLVETSSAAPNPSSPLGASKRMRSARCGVCAACNADDCGECKNCVDKPKFGGPGNRKQACTMRTCIQLRVVEEASEGRYSSDDANSDANYESDDNSTCEPCSAPPAGAHADDATPYSLLETLGSHPTALSALSTPAPPKHAVGPLLAFPALAEQRAQLDELRRASSVEM